MSQEADNASLSGSLSDPDGPHGPLAVWDFGDATPLQYGPAAAHRYARPGTYTVLLQAADGILRRTDSVTVNVVGPGRISNSTP